MRRASGPPWPLGIAGHTFVPGDPAEGVARGFPPRLVLTCKRCGQVESHRIHPTPTRKED